MQDMEASMEEQVALRPLPPPPDNNDVSTIAKGKRTKRYRPHSPIPFTITTTTHGQDPPFSAASSEESTTTSEVDTARCLILLSRGHHFSTNNGRPHNNAMATASRGGTRTGGTYACKTCGRSFPSFQALGGHRTSHKKPRNDKKLFTFSDEDDFPSPQRNMFSPNSLSLQLSNISSTTFSAAMKSSPSPRMHECSYCGAEFTSGQALGGHMRKHRGGGFVTRSPNIDAYVGDHEILQEAKIGLSLDLNLPAPEDAAPEKNNKDHIGTTAAAGRPLPTTNIPLTPHDHSCH